MVSFQHLCIAAKMIVIVLRFKVQIFFMPSDKYLLSKPQPLKLCQIQANSSCQFCPRSLPVYPYMCTAGVGHWQNL